MKPYVVSIMHTGTRTLCAALDIDRKAGDQSVHVDRVDATAIGDYYVVIPERPIADVKKSWCRRHKGVDQHKKAAAQYQFMAEFKALLLNEDRAHAIVPMGNKSLFDWYLRHISTYTGDVYEWDWNNKVGATEEGVCHAASPAVDDIWDRIVEQHG